MSGKDGFLHPYQYDYELAKMAGAIYKDEDAIRKSMEHPDPDKRLLPDGWTVLPDSFEDTNARTGFVAGAFIKPKTKQIVIAYRGSEPKGPEAHDLIDYKGANVAIAQDGDMRGVTDNLALRAAGQLLARQQAPDWHAQFEQGLNYAERILKQSQTMPGGPYTVHVTGHSLAGAVAQVTHEMFDLPGRTFDPGGAQNLVQSHEFKAWRSEYYGSRDDGLRRADRDPEGRGFSNYLVNDSLVSRYSGPHVGRVEDVTGYGGRETFGDKTSYHVKRLLDGPVGAIGSAFNVVELHDMDRIIRVFKDAQQTGELNRLGDLTPQPSEPDILRPGDQGRAVAHLQSGLIELGYHHRVSQPLQANGTYDDATRQAITAFQARHDVEISGSADLATQHALQQALLMHQQMAEQKQAENKTRQDECKSEQTRAGERDAERLHYDDPRHREHQIYATLADKLDQRGQLQEVSKEQLHAMAAQMHWEGFKPDWQGDAMVRGGHLIAQDTKGHRAAYDLNKPTQSVEATMQEVRDVDLHMAQVQEAHRQQDLTRAPPSPGQPGGPPLP